MVYIRARGSENTQTVKRGNEVLLSLVPSINVLEKMDEEEVQLLYIPRYT